MSWTCNMHQFRIKRIHWFVCLWNIWGHIGHKKQIVIVSYTFWPQKKHRPVEFTVWEWLTESITSFICRNTSLGPWVFSDDTCHITNLHTLGLIQCNENVLSVHFIPNYFQDIVAARQRYFFPLEGGVVRDGTTTIHLRECFTSSLFRV
jgi:hypothetical protein